MPVEIKKTQDKGYGVYAVRDIEENHIIGTYNGIIGTQMSVDLKDDSMFNIGWISKG